MFTLPDTKTDKEAKQMSCIELRGGVHTAQRQTLTQSDSYWILC